MILIVFYCSFILCQLEVCYVDQFLMQCVGVVVVDWVVELVGDCCLLIFVLVGFGNNGGDVFEMVCLLCECFFDVSVVFVVDFLLLLKDVVVVYCCFCDVGGIMLENILDEVGWVLIIDGFFGIGLMCLLVGCYVEWIVIVNQLVECEYCFVLVLDCFFGFNVDIGEVLGLLICVSYMVIFILVKLGLLIVEGFDYCGEICIVLFGLQLEVEFLVDGY